MIAILTSHLGGSYKVDGRRLPRPIAEENGLLGKLKDIWPSDARVLMICADPVDYEKNDAENIFPEEIAPQSHKKVYWKCPYCGKERYTSPHYRIGSRRYCKCSNRKIVET